MSLDLNFWKYQKDVYLDSAVVYQSACCDKKEIEGLEILPIVDILKEVSTSFHEWTSLDTFNYERNGYGSFQISTTPQTVRFDCYSMQQTDMKRFSSIMSKFDCQLYDPRQSIRFDKIVVFLIDEAGEYKTQVEQEFSRLLPRLEIVAQVISWAQYAQLSQTNTHIQYDLIIHRAKTLTKVTSTMKFGTVWANRPCQCKTAQLEDKDKAYQLLSELIKKSIERVVSDFLERTYYE